MVEDYVVDRWLDRGNRFFRAITRNPVVRGQLLARGLTDEELRNGWELYTKVFGISGLSTEPVPKNTGAADAMNELDAWDAPNFRAIGQVLSVRFPAAGAFLFEGLTAGEGPEAVSAVALFVERYKQLQRGAAPNVPAQDAQAAIALLARRLLVTPGILDRLETLVATAQRGAVPLPVTPPDPATDEAIQAYVAWISEWREVARIAVQRRDYRIALGLAHRRQRQNVAEEPEDELEEDEVEDDEMEDDEIEDDEN